MKRTQGELIAHHLKRRPMTYMQMHALGVSTSPQKRAVEWLARHDVWKLAKAKRGDGLVTWRLVRA